MSTNSACGDPWNFSANGHSDKFDTSSFTAGTGLMIATSPTWSSIELNLPADKHFQELSTRIAEIEKQMMILRPDIAMQEKYPALQEAYDAYQVILKLVKDNAKIHE